jgi:hypothetical protein
MNIVLFNSPSDGRLALATGEGGAPVLRMEGVPNVRDGDYGPSDILRHGEMPMYAAGYVQSWALDKCRSDAGIEAARAFLRQWPDGPQAEPDDLEQARAENDALDEAAESLNAGHPPIERMSADELRDYIPAMVDRLAEEEPDSPAAMIIRIRLKLAATLLRGFAG